MLRTLGSCISFLERPNKLSSRRQKHIIVPVENKIRQEKRDGTLVNRQDMLSYFLAQAMSSSDVKEVNEELVDVIALLATCVCDPDAE